MGEIKTVAVLGLGTMGSGIAQVCAQAGFKVIAREINDEFLERGMGIINKNLTVGVKKGKVTEEQMQETLSRFQPTTNIEDVAQADLVIEAMIEDINLKKTEFKKLDEICPPHTIFASNTSSLSVTDMASATNREDKVCGLHFFNPAFLMKLVEVVKGLETSDETMKIATEFVNNLNKIPVTAQDNPGFIVNLLLIPFLNDAAKAYEAGVASAEDIDASMKFGAGHPMGPLTLIDLIGIDVHVKVGDILYDSYKDPKYSVPPLMRRMVKAGHLGRKSGRGFYKYD